MTCDFFYEPMKKIELLIKNKRANQTQPEQRAESREGALKARGKTIQLVVGSVKNLRIFARALTALDWELVCLIEE